MNEPSARRLLLDRGTLLLDAAMGTRLIARGLDLRDDDPCAWNLSRPDDVLDIHRRDVAAGSDVLLTNTFGANRAWLERLGLADRFVAINRAAVALARQAAGPDRLVFGGLGPTSVSSPDLGACRDQAVTLAEAGVDGLIFETMDLPAALVALDVVAPIIREGLPVVVSFWTWPDDADAAIKIENLGASAIGLNCVWPARKVVEMVRTLVGSTRLPVWVKPSGAMPGQRPATPEELARVAVELSNLGARFVGGCCGTTEVHLAAMRRALDSGVAPIQA
ncbi:homocysteine S-methyltransferase family protein [Isosphaeraceae bacterium EP7]